MSYNIVVCAKQVPDTKNITGEAMNEDGTVNRASLPTIYNPEDHNALEAALELRDRCGGTVTVITMGPPAASEVLRESLYMGADKAVLITDRRAAASDTLATSYILSCAVKKLGANVVLCGRQAIDGDTAQTGPQMADKLDFTLVTYLEEIVDATEDSIRLRRDVSIGWEEVTTPLPTLITVTDTANVPRPQATRKVMKFKKARTLGEITGELGGRDADASAVEVKKGELESKGLLIESWDLDDIEADLKWVGMSGSPTKVRKIESVVLSASGEHQSYQPVQEEIDGLVKELIEEHTIG